MSDYTAQEIETALEADDDLDWYDLEDEEFTFTLRGAEVTTEPIEQFGGEGQGDDIWFVFKLGDQLFRKSGYYASHYGTDWDGDLEEVKPAEKTITVYEAV